MTRKLVVVGDHMVGKNCLLHAFFGHQIETSYVPCVFHTIDVTIQVDGEPVKNTTFVYL